MNRIAEQALEAHRQLDEEIEELRAAMDAEIGERSNAWLAQAVESFRRFHTNLRRHIEIEESGGFLEPVVQRRPTLTPQVDQLMHEHREMVECCEGLEHDMHSADKVEPADVDALRGRVHDLLVALQKHEHTENAIVQDVFSQDIGTGD